MKLVNNDTGETRELIGGLSAELSDTDEDRLGGTSKRTLVLGNTDWENYTLSLKAQKSAAPKDSIFILENATITINCTGTLVAGKIRIPPCVPE
jgi:hypothetical protein